MSVLPVPEVSGGGDGEGGGEDGWSQGPERSSSNQTPEQSGSGPSASRGFDYLLSQGSCRVNSQIGKFGLLSGD